MNKDKQTIRLAAVCIILAICIGAGAALIHNRGHNKHPSGVSTSTNQSTPQPKLAQKVVDITVKSGQIVSGSSTIDVAPNQPIKMTVHGQGYGEGDNLNVEGDSQTFFDLDEFDEPTTQYFSLSKIGTYPLIVSTTSQRVGQIVVQDY